MSIVPEFEIVARPADEEPAKTTSPRFEIWEFPAVEVSANPSAPPADRLIVLEAAVAPLLKFTLLVAPILIIDPAAVDPLKFVAPPCVLEIVAVPALEPAKKFV